jgi:hypothetical protein
MYPHEQLTFARLFVGRIYLVTLAVIILLGFVATQTFGYFTGSPWYFWFNVIFGGLFVLLSFLIAFSAINTAELQEKLDSKADIEKLLLQIIENAARDEAFSVQKLFNEYLSRLEPSKANTKMHLSMLSGEIRTKLYSCCKDMISAEKKNLAIELSEMPDSSYGRHIKSTGEIIAKLEWIEELLQA